MRKFVNTALVATLMGVALAQTTVTQEGVGSTSAPVTFNASVGAACTLTVPTNVIVAPILYWTNSAGTTATATYNVVLRCNQDTDADASYDESTTLYLNGNPASPYTVTATTDLTGITGDAYTSGGLVGQLLVSVPRPTMDIPAGTYRGTTNWVLQVYGPVVP